MTVAQVRTIVSDRPQPYRHTATGDGTTTLYPLPFRPVQTGSDTITIDGTPTTAYTLDDDTGRITFTAAPADGAVIVADYTWSVLADTDITTFLDLADDDPRQAAAMALDTIATNEALVSKRIKLLEITTDGPAVAKSLREHAAVLRAQADADDDFDYAEMAVDDFAARDMVYNRALRGEL